MSEVPVRLSTHTQQERFCQSFTPPHFFQLPASQVITLNLNTAINRRTLATSPYLVSHIPPPSKTALASMTGPISSLEPLPPPPNPCQHHFLTPLSWMRSELEQGILSGRLECPTDKCKAQIGRYAWQGMRCSCGIWVLPAFTLQKSRVDEVVKKVAVTDTTGKPGGIRLPPGMKGKGNL